AYTITNLAARIIAGGGRVAVTERGKSSTLKADLDGEQYTVTSVAVKGSLNTRAWRALEGADIPLYDKKSNISPTRTDELVMVLSQEASDAEPEKLPRGRIPNTL
ncbi:MAG: hypothetical protein WCT14_18990, partial [Treponemataceae bacterium]